MERVYRNSDNWLSELHKREVALFPPRIYPRRLSASQVLTLDHLYEYVCIFITELFNLYVCVKIWGCIEISGRVNCCVSVICCFVLIKIVVFYLFVDLIYGNGWKSLVLDWKLGIVMFDCVGVQCLIFIRISFPLLLIKSYKLCFNVRRSLQLSAVGSWELEPPYK